MKHQAMKGDYDVIVVGGGTGGLVAGGLLAKAGRSVLVLEAEDRPGGYARSFDSGACSFDLADHLVMSCAPSRRFGDGLLYELLSTLGVADKVSFVAIDPFYAVHYQGRRFVIPGGWDAHIAALSEYFPAETSGIKDLFAFYDQAYRETIAAPVETQLRTLATFPFRFRTLFGNRKHTVAELFAPHINDPVLRTVHTALWPYLGLPPSRASAIGWGAMMGSYAGEGAFYPLGGYQKLSNAFAEGLRRHGGELRCGERVEAIRSQDGRVTGVTTSGGAQIQASTVIAAMDPRETMGPMLKGDVIPGRYRRRLENSELSISVYALYLAVDLVLDPAAVAHETAVMTADSEEVASRGLAGDVRMVLVTTPTLTESERAQSAQQTVVIKTLCPPPGVVHDREAVATAMLDLAGRAIPGLREGIAHVHGRTEQEPWPLRRMGPIYGWAMTPEQMGTYRLGHKTPIDGLFVAGHWSQPTAGIWGAAASAVQVVRHVLERAPRQGLVPIRLSS